MNLFTRAFYISGRNAALAHSRPEYGIEIYYYEGRDNRPCALYFAGKAVNPNIKLATFTIIILVNKSFRIACSPG